MSLTRESRQSRSAFTFSFSGPGVDFSLNYERISLAAVLAEYPEDPQTDRAAYCGEFQSLLDNYLVPLPSGAYPDPDPFNIHQYDGHGKFLMVEQCSCRFAYRALVVDRVHHTPEPEDEEDPDSIAYTVRLQISSASSFSAKDKSRVVLVTGEEEEEEVIETTPAVPDVTVIAAGNAETNGEQTIVVTPWPKLASGQWIKLENSLIRVTVSSSGEFSFGVDGLRADIASLVPDVAWRDNLQVTTEFDGLRVGFIKAWGKQAVGSLSEVANNMVVYEPDEADFSHIAVSGSVEWVDDNGYNLVEFSMPPVLATGDFAGTVVVNKDSIQYGGPPGVDFTITIA